MPVTEGVPQSQGLSWGCSPAQVTSLPNLAPSVKTAPALLVGKGSKGPPNGKSFLSQDRLAEPMDGGQDPSETISPSGPSADLGDFQPLWI